MGNQLNKFVKNLCDVSGLVFDVPVAYLGHSTRSGGVSTAVSIGVPVVPTLMLRGGWKSSAVHVYLHELPVDCFSWKFFGFLRPPPPPLELAGSVV